MTKRGQLATVIMGVFFILYAGIGTLGVFANVPDVEIRNDIRGGLGLMVYLLIGVPLMLGWLRFR